MQINLARVIIKEKGMICSKLKRIKPGNIVKMIYKDIIIEFRVLESLNKFELNIVLVRMFFLYNKHIS